MSSQKYKDLYIQTIYANVAKRLDIKNPHQIPQIKKIVINRGLGESAQVASLLSASRKELGTITGQWSVQTIAKKSIAAFKVREGMTIGCMVTLRGEKMYAFLDRLVHLALPRIRDFRGIRRSGFDGKGNYTLGVTDQLLFPEVDFDKVAQLQGMNISIVTTANTDRDAEVLLETIGIPFIKTTQD
jgi:large subunit ribosomal protein L5